MKFASRGTRDLDAGREEPITDETLRETLRARAKVVYLKTTAAAAILSLAGSLLPD